MSAQHKSNIGHITEGYVREIIADLSAKDSHGHDDISTKLLKSLSSHICKPLTLVVNQCLQTSIFPDNMKLAKIITIFKKRRLFQDEVL